MPFFCIFLLINEKIKKGEAMKKIANLGISLIPFLNNFIILDFYFYPKFYSDAGYGMFFYFILGMLFSFLLGLITTNFIYNPIRFIRKKKILKLLFAIYLLIMIALGLSFSSVALSSIFYINETPLKFIIILLVISGFMLNIKVTTLINTAAIMATIGIPLILYNTISHFYLIDIGSILYVRPSFNIIDIALIIFVCLDTFIYTLLIPYFKKMNKRLLVSGTIIYFMIEGLEALALVLMLGNSLQGYYGFGYFLYSIEPLSGLIGNFDFVYIFMIALSTIFKLSFSFNVLKLLYYEKKQYTIPISYLVVAIASFYISKFYYQIDEYIAYALIGISAFLLMFLLYLRRIQNEYIKSRSLA